MRKFRRKTRKNSGPRVNRQFQYSGKNPSEKVDYSKALNLPVIQKIYDFIYGSKKDEIDILMRGLQISFDKAQSGEEKRGIHFLTNFIHGAWIDEKKDRARRFRLWANESVDVVVKKATNGDDPSLFKLIEFDKRRLSEVFVQRRITKAQTEKDKNFFFLLGEAVQSTTGLLEGTRGRSDERQKNLKKLLRLLRILKFDFSQNDTASKLMDIIERQLNQSREESLPRPETSQVLKRTAFRMGLPVVQ